MFHVLKAIWYVCRLYVTSITNKTDVLIEYQKECDEVSKRMNSIPELQAIFDKYKHLDVVAMRTDR